LTEGRVKETTRLNKKHGTVPSMPQMGRIASTSRYGLMFRTTHINGETFGESSVRGIGSC